MRFCHLCGTQLVAPLAPAQAEPTDAAVELDLAAAQPAAVAAKPAAAAAACAQCGGNGAHLKPEEDVCPQCAWLRPLYPGYQLDRSVFLWAQDGQAMSRLQAIPALHQAVLAVSDRMGRPWIESTFNGIRLGPWQLPEVWKVAVVAARILGLSRMPDVYIAGDSMWVTYTFGSDTNAFIVLGTAILNNFQNEDLLFILAREMGHCRAGHALWKSLTRFLAGDITVRNGPLAGGFLNILQHPTKLLQSAWEVPLMAWSRQSDITADRAGLLALGDEIQARRALLAWSIRSSRILKQVNIEEWIKQEDESNDTLTRFSEATTSSTMYTTRRLRLLRQAAGEPDLMRFSQNIQPYRKKLLPPAAPPPARPRSAPLSPAVTKDSLRVICVKCQTAMRVPFSVLRGKQSLNVRCPECKSITVLRSQPKPSAPAAAGVGTQPATPPPTPPGETK
jgi:Zn-dependent protease with chaperone function/DNA-directed RNA polymerase subunit RPC12/RpoP